MFDFSRIPSHVILAGDERTAYRDPAVIYEGGRFYLFCTKTECCEGGPYMTTVETISEDLINWSSPVEITPRDRSLNFSSPGNVIRLKTGEYLLCLQTYCRENGEKYGNERSRLWTMKSRNLMDWDAPQLLRVKGEIPEEDMGRMIDPYLIEDIHEKGRWWCLYKQRGMSMSFSYDLVHWTYHGRVECGENVCAIRDGGAYRIYHSPQNGIGMLKTDNMMEFAPCGALITLGQKEWPWAQGRITAGFVLDMTEHPEYGGYLMFFHGSGPEDEETMFDHHASIGMVWSEDIGFAEWR